MRAHLGAVALSADGRTALAVGERGTILRSADGGLTWNRVGLHRRGVPPVSWLLLAVAFVSALPAFRPPPPPERRKAAGDAAALFATDRPLAPGAPDVAGADTLARRISAFLRNTRTVPPLTLAIVGPWGSGKSSVLNRLHDDLRAHGLRPVWFNAWHHRREEHLFAALLQAVRAKAVPGWFAPGGFRRSIEQSVQSAVVREVALRPGQDRLANPHGGYNGASSRSVRARSISPARRPADDRSQHPQAAAPPASCPARSDAEPSPPRLARHEARRPRT